MGNTSVKSVSSGMTTAANVVALFMPIEDLAANDFIPDNFSQMECCLPEESFIDPYYEAVADRLLDQNAIENLVSSTNFEKDMDYWLSTQKTLPRENVRYKTIELLKALLTAEELNKARILLKMVVTHFSDDQSFKTANYILAPPKIVGKNKSDIEGFQDTIQFFRNLGANFKRKWVAVSMGQLLDISDSYNILAQRYTDKKRIFISKIL